MDPDAVKSTLTNLAYGNVLAAAARDYQKELLAQNKANASTSVNEEVDLDELMDVSEPCIFIICLLLVSKNVFLQDPELEKLHADRIAALKKDAEKRQKLKMQGHGEYREITASEKVICHFYHRKFYHCKIMDKHLKSLAPRHFTTKFVKLDAELSISRI